MNPATKITQLKLLPLFSVLVVMYVGEGYGTPLSQECELLSKPMDEYKRTSKLDGIMIRFLMKTETGTMTIYSNVV